MNLQISNEMTDFEIVGALRSINQLAKKLRNSKNENFYKGKHGNLKNIDFKVRKLYELKNIVIEKLLSENRLTVLGIHKQEINYFIGRTPIPTTNYLTLFDFNGFKFHRPSTSEEISKHKVIGEIGIIQERNNYTVKSFNEKDAKKILFAFTK